MLVQGDCDPKLIALEQEGCSSWSSGVLRSYFHKTKTNQAMGFRTNCINSNMMDTSYYPYAALSCASFLTFYRKVSPAMSVKYFPIYSTLPHAKQVEWNTRTLSSLHSVMVSMICLYVLLYEDRLSHDPVWADSNTVKLTCALVIGYMLSDSIVMLIHYREIGEVGYIFHHIASIYAFYFVMTYGALSWFANFRLIAEFSTPFVNHRWFLDVTGYPRKSRVFVLNGLALTSIFFLARIVSIPPYWYKVYSVCDSETSYQLGRLWYMLIVSCLVLDIINIFWFYKLYQGVRRILNNNDLMCAWKTS